MIPKTHIENVYEFTPELSKEYFEAVPKIARAIRDEFEPIGLNILNNNGEKASTIGVPFSHAYHSALRKRRRFRGCLEAPRRRLYA